MPTLSMNVASVALPVCRVSCSWEVPQTTQEGLGSLSVIAVIMRLPARFW